MFEEVNNSRAAVGSMLNRNKHLIKKMNSRTDATATKCQPNVAGRNIEITSNMFISSREVAGAHKATRLIGNMVLILRRS